MAEISLEGKDCEQLPAVTQLPHGLGLILDWETRLADHLGCSSRRENADILLNKTLGKVEQASLVIDRDDSNALGSHL